jgi:hypothetical protein
LSEIKAAGRLRAKLKALDKSGTPAVQHHRRRISALLIAAACCAPLALAPQAQAHHSYAAFDRSKKTELSGAVKAWEWTNPHVWLSIVVTRNGKAEVWSFEGLAPASLRSKGWSRTMVKAGDKVTVAFSPRRDGTAGGALISVTTSDGRVFGGDPPAL